MSEAEFEIGHEIDRALRAAVTGLAQVIERSARRQADQSRSAAAQARQDWLTGRDRARRQYLPWLNDGSVENSDPASASRAWSVAAAWSSMDPEARAAEEQLASRIETKHGRHPARILQDPAEHPVSASDERKRLLTTREAIGLAREKAPFYWDRDQLASLEPGSDEPQSEAVRRVQADWRYYSESGSLPERSQWEQWARYVGRADEVDPARWRTPGGAVDEEAREDALKRIWAEGAEERNHREIEVHQAAMSAAGMGDLGGQVDMPADAGAWRAMISEEAFNTATPEQAVKAWRDATALGAEGDPVARAAAEQLGTRIKTRHGVDPSDYLLGAMTERAANHTEERRRAEDKAQAADEARLATAVSSMGRGSAAAGGTQPAASAQPMTVTRERVVELNEQAQAYFGENLRPGSTGHKYLVDRLGDGVMEGPWALGYAPDAWTGLTRRLQRAGATDDEILAAGLGRMSSKGNVIDAFRGRAMVGIRDTDGALVGFVGRDLTGDKRAPRYVNTGATAAFKKSEQVFGLYEAQPRAKLVRTEGAFDAIATTLAGEGEVAGVAPMGTALSDVQAARIGEKCVDDRVWLANDRDTGGVKATEHDFYTLGRQGLKARTVAVPGSDPAEAWQKQPGLMRNTMGTLDTAPSAGELIIDTYIKEHGDALRGDEPDARRGLDDTVRSVSAVLDDPVDARLLAVQTEQRRRQLLSEADTAYTTAGRAEVVEQKLDQAAEQTHQPDRADRLGQAAGYVDRRGEEFDITGNQLQDDAAAATSPPAAPAQPPRIPYDRAAESNLENLTPVQRDARVVSAHGFSEPTADAIGRAATRSGSQARPDRGGEAQRRGRARTR